MSERYIVATAHCSPTHYLVYFMGERPYFSYSKSMAMIYTNKDMAEAAVRCCNTYTGRRWVVIDESGMDNQKPVQIRDANILPPPISAQRCLDIICEAMLGSGFCVTVSMPQNQVNFVMLDNVLNSTRRGRTWLLSHDLKKIAEEDVNAK